MRKAVMSLLTWSLLLAPVGGAVAGELEDQLFRAVGYFDADAVRQLIARGADVNATQESGFGKQRSVYALALESGYFVCFDEEENETPDDPDCIKNDMILDMLKAAGAQYIRGK